MGKESIQSSASVKEQVAADHGRDAAQLKADHGKEMAALKAEEAKLLAAQKADHAKTPGGTGLIAKLTGREDPVKVAEKQELKAEIARAEDTTKAHHDAENAHLKANKSGDMAAVNAAEKLGSNNAHGAHGAAAGALGAGALGAGALGAGALAHGAHGSHAIPEGIPDNKIYNHATGAHGQAALADNGNHHHHGIAAFADNGLGDRHHNNSNQAGFNQGQAGFNQGMGMQGGMPMAGGMQGGMPMAGAAPMAVMPLAQPMMAAAPMATNTSVPLATHGALASHSAPLAAHGAPLASHSAPLAAHSAPLSSGASNDVAVLAPSHHSGNRL